jgi:hypothetical protein
MTFFSKSIFTSYHGGGLEQLLLLQQGRQTHFWLRLEHEGKARQNEMPYVFFFFFFKSFQPGEL